MLGKRNVPFILRVRKMQLSVIISSACYQEPELHSTFLCIQTLDIKMVQNLYTLKILFTHKGERNMLYSAGIHQGPRAAALIKDRYGLDSSELE